MPVLGNLKVMFNCSGGSAYYAAWICLAAAKRSPMAAILISENNKGGLLVSQVPSKTSLWRNLCNLTIDLYPDIM